MRINFLIAWLILFTLIILHENIFAENFLKNGKFSNFTTDGIPSHWSNCGKLSPGGKWREDRENFISAPSSLRLENPQEGYKVRFEQDFTPVPGKEYIFSFYIKGNEVKGKNGARAMITLENGRWLTGGSLDGLWKQKTGTFNWEKCEFKFICNGSGKLKVILSFLDAQGTIWFDDVSVTEVNNASTTLPGFPAAGRLFPVIFQKEPYAICENIPGMLLLEIEGQRKALLESGLKIELILPSELYFIGASPNFSYKVPAENYYDCTPEKFSIETENHYFVDINPNILNRIKEKGYSWGNYDRIFIGTKQGNIGKQVSVRWRLIAGNKEGPEHSFSVKIVNSIDLENIKCKLFRSFVMYPTAQTAPFIQVVDAYEKFWTSLSNSIGARTLLNIERCSPEVKERFLKNFKPSLFFGLDLKSSIPKERYEKMPPLIWSDSKTRPSESTEFMNIETYYLIEDPEGSIWDKAFPLKINNMTDGKIKPEMIIFDYEPFIEVNGFSNGFSLENRERFAKYANLNITPSIRDIQTKYNKQWISFRRYQYSLVVKKFCASVHRHFPEVKAVLATDVLRSEGALLSSWCCTDPRLSDDDVDLFMNMPYYTGLKFYKDIELNNKLLKKKNFPFIDPSERDKSLFDRYTGPKIKQNIIAAAALGCVGIAFWPTDCLDADYLSSIANAFFAVSTAEDCYFTERCDDNLKITIINVFSETIDNDGEKCVINYPNFEKNLKILMHRKNDEYVITALNYDPKNQVIVQAAIPRFSSGKFQVADAVSLKSFPYLTAEKIRDGFLFSVPPNGAAVIRIGRQKFIAKESFSQDKLKETGQTMLAKFKNENSFRTLKKDSAKIHWATMTDKDDIPVLKLQNNNGKVYIDANNGANIVAWFNSSNKNPLRYRKQYGHLGDFILYDPSQCHEPYKFELTEIDIRNNSPEALFSYTVPEFEGANPVPNPLQGLVVNKRILLSPDGKRIYIDLTLINKSPRKTTMNLGFRVRSLPYLGASFSGLSAPVEITTLSWGKDNEIKPTNHMMYLKSNCKIDFLPNIRRLPWNDSGVIFVSAQDGSLRESFNFEAKKAAGFFIWRSPELYTVELLSEMISLSYGKTYQWSLIITRTP